MTILNLFLKKLMPHKFSVQRSRILWLNLLLIITAGTSFLWMLFGKHEQHIHQSNTNAMNAFIIKPTYQKYDQSGQLHSRFTAHRMQHFEREDQSFFTKPKLTIYTDDRIPWHISSTYGRSQSGTKTVLLYQDVVLHQPQRPSHPETTITTNTLTFYPKRSFAENHKKVTIIRPSTMIHGKGIEADLKKGTVKLIHQSKGVYEPSITFQQDANRKPANRKPRNTQ